MLVLQTLNLVMKSMLLLAALFALAACGSNNTNDRSEPALKDPQTVQPASDAIPDSIKIVNDSVLMPKDSPGRGKVITSDQKPIEQ